MTITTYPPAEQRVLLTGVTWERYLAILGEDEHDGRMAYDQGHLEIMTVGPEHESLKKLISRLLEHDCFARRIKIHPLGNFTMNLEDLQKGIEADDCYYIQSLDKIDDFHSLAFPGDPPPDLVVEVDITNPSFNKLGIYAALGVNEVWQFNQDHLTILFRRDESGYIPGTASRCLPEFPLHALNTAIEAYLGGSSHHEAMECFVDLMG